METQDVFIIQSKQKAFVHSPGPWHAKKAGNGLSFTMPAWPSRQFEGRHKDYKPCWGLSGLVGVLWRKYSTPREFLWKTPFAALNGDGVPSSPPPSPPVLTPGGDRDWGEVPSSSFCLFGVPPGDPLGRRVGDEAAMDGGIPMPFSP